MTEQPPEAPEEPRTYTVNQLAGILQVDRGIILKHTRNGWPHLNLGPRTIRYTPEHLNTILATTETKTPERSTRRRTRRTP